MNIGDFSSTSSCRHCQHYQIEGRRGGHCTLLSVPVRSEWSACSLGVPAFTPARVSVANQAETNMVEAKVSEAIAFNNPQLDLVNTEKTLTNRILTISQKSLSSL